MFDSTKFVWLSLDRLTRITIKFGVWPNGWAVPVWISRLKLQFSSSKVKFDILPRPEKTNFAYCSTFSKFYLTICYYGLEGEVLFSNDFLDLGKKIMISAENQGYVLRLRNPLWFSKGVLSGWLVVWLHLRGFLSCFVLFFSAPRISLMYLEWETRTRTLTCRLKIPEWSLSPTKSTHDFNPFSWP